MEEGAAALVREVGRPTHSLEILLFDGEHRIARVRIQNPVAVRTAGKLPAFGH